MQRMACIHGMRCVYCMRWCQDREGASQSAGGGDAVLAADEDAGGEEGRAGDEGNLIKEVEELKKKLHEANTDVAEISKELQEAQAEAAAKGNAAKELQDKLNEAGTYLYSYVYVCVCACQGQVNAAGIYTSTYGQGKVSDVGKAVQEKEAAIENMRKLQDHESGRAERMVKKMEVCSCLLLPVHLHLCSSVHVSWILRQCKTSCSKHKTV